MGLEKKSIDTRPPPEKKIIVSDYSTTMNDGCMGFRKSLIRRDHNQKNNSGNRTTMVHGT